MTFIYNCVAGFFSADAKVTTGIDCAAVIEVLAEAGHAYVGEPVAVFCYLALGQAVLL